MFGLDFSARQLKTALDILTALVVISVAWALAGLTWRIAGHAGTGAVMVPTSSMGPAVAPGVGPAVALAPFGKSSASDAAQPTTLPLELKGVIAVLPASLSTAYIAVTGNGAAQPFHVGDAVNGAVIQSILRDRVLLQNGGRIEFLAFPDPTLSAEQRAAQAQPAAPAGGASPIASAPVAPSSPGGSAASLISRLDATPDKGGYRIGQNAPPGLLPGDVVQSVNGTALGDPQAAQAAFAAAQASGSAQITIMRDGKPITLTLPTQ